MLPPAATGALEISLATSSSGSFSGSAALSLFSHDAYLADLALSAGPVILEGVVDNYAVAALAETSGGGSVTSQSATSTAIDLGQIALGASPASIGLEALNAATGTADLLGGTLTAAGSSAFLQQRPGQFLRPRRRRRRHRAAHYPCPPRTRARLPKRSHCSPTAATPAATPAPARPRPSPSPAPSSGRKPLRC